VTLAARVDSFHESTDGHIGIEYKEDIEKKIDKVRIRGFKKLQTFRCQFLIF
jgi:RNA processing factor Prp31